LFWNDAPELEEYLLLQANQYLFLKDFPKTTCLSFSKNWIKSDLLKIKLAQNRFLEIKNVQPFCEIFGS
jgi:hypothetical protein